MLFGDGENSPSLPCTGTHMCHNPSVVRLMHFKSPAPPIKGGFKQPTPTCNDWNGGTSHRYCVYSKWGVTLIWHFIDVYMLQTHFRDVHGSEGICLVESGQAAGKKFKTTPKKDTNCLPTTKQPTKKRFPIPGQTQTGACVNKNVKHIRSNQP